MKQESGVWSRRAWLQWMLAGGVALGTSAPFLLQKSDKNLKILPHTTGFDLHSKHPLWPTFYLSFEGLMIHPHDTGKQFYLHGHKLQKQEYSNGFQSIVSGGMEELGQKKQKSGKKLHYKSLLKAKWHWPYVLELEWELVDFPKHLIPRELHICLDLPLMETQSTHPFPAGCRCFPLRTFTPCRTTHV